MASTALDSLFRLSKTHAHVVRELETRLGGHHGLSFSELRLLRAIADAPDERARPGTLAEELEITASGVTRAVLPLEKRGIVKRAPDPGDARASRIALTPAGKSLLENATKTAGETSTRLLRRLSVGQVRQLERLLGDIG